MSTEEIKSLVQRYLAEVFSKGNLEAIDDYVGTEHEKHGVRNLVTKYRTGFPDFQITVEDLVAEGDKVVTLEKLSGTHRGEYRTRTAGIISPTGRQATWRRIAIRRFVDGKMLYGTHEEDESGLLRQLGVIPPPGQIGS